MRSTVSSRLSKALCLLCAASLCFGLLPATALASQDSLSLIPEGGEGAVSIPSGAEGGGDDVLALRSEAAPSVDGGGAVISSEDVSDTEQEQGYTPVDRDVIYTAVHSLTPTDAPSVPSSEGDAEDDGAAADGADVSAPSPASDGGSPDDAAEGPEASGAVTLAEAPEARYSVLFDMNGGEPYPALDGFGFRTSCGGPLPDISNVIESAGRPIRPGFVFTGFYDGSDHACANKCYAADLTVDATCEVAAYPYGADCLRLYAGWAPIIDVTVPASLAVAVGTSPDVDAPTVVVSGGAVENRTAWKLRCEEISWDASEVSEGDVPLLAHEQSLAAALERESLAGIFSDTGEVRLSMSANGGGGKVSPGGRASLRDSPIEVAAGSAIGISYGIEVGAGTDIEGEKWSRTRLLMPFEAVFEPAPDARSAILFDPNGGRGGQTLSLVGVCGQALPALTEGVAAPVLEGHDFLGYFDDPRDFGAEHMLYTAEMEPVAGRTWESRTAKALYAGWAAKGCGVVLDAGEGAVVDADSGRTKRYSLPYGTVLEDAFPNGLPTPRHSKGYPFAGWYDAEGAAPDMGMRLTDAASDLVLHARFDGEPATVVWDACGTPSDPARVDPASWQTETGRTLGEMGELPVPVREGFDFGGWFSRPGGQGVEASADTVVRGDVAYYASWSPSLVTLSWIVEEGDVRSHKLYYGSTVSFPDGVSATPVKPGRAFEGWYVADEAGEPSGERVEFASSTPVPREDTVWVAKWTVLEYEVAFDLAGGEGEVSSVKARYGEELPEPATYRVSYDGYALEGWYDAPDGGAKYLNADGAPCRAWDKEEGATLYAHWTANKVTIHWMPQTGDPTITTTQTWSPDAMLVFPSDPVRDGYAFMGWWTGAGTGQGSRLDAPCSLPWSSGTVFLFAHWSDDPVTLVFNANGGTGTVPEPWKLPYGSSRALPNCAIEREGYVFAGWAEAPDGGKTFEVEGLFDSTTVPSGTIKTLYAHWSPKPVTLVFNLNGGMGSAPLSWDMRYDPYGCWGLPDCGATRTGYTFDGWADAPDGARRYAPGDLWRPCDYHYAETMHLYAHWEPNTYTFTWADMDDPSADHPYAQDSYKYNPNALLAFPPDPTRFGYIFKGWRTGPGLENGVEVSPPMNLPSWNQTFFAVWRPIQFNYQWLPNYEGAPQAATTSASYTENVCIPMPPTPTRPGYRFKEWRTGASPGLGQTVDSSWTLREILEMGSGSGGDVNQIMFAIWEPA